MPCADRKMRRADSRRGPPGHDRMPGGEPDQMAHPRSPDHTGQPERPACLVRRPAHADDPLPKSGSFVDESAARRPGMQTKPFRRFLSHNKSDDGEERSVIELTFYSTPMVYLFHLPPHGQITLAGLPLRARVGFDSSKFKELTVLEADDLLVNGKTPLEEWLPYQTMSDADAKADRMDFFKPKTADDLESPKEGRATSQGTGRIDPGDPYPTLDGAFRAAGRGGPARQAAWGWAVGQCQPVRQPGKSRADEAPKKTAPPNP